MSSTSNAPSSSLSCSSVLAADVCVRQSLLYELLDEVHSLSGDNETLRNVNEALMRRVSLQAALLKDLLANPVGRMSEGDDVDMVPRPFPVRWMSEDDDADMVPRPFTRVDEKVKERVSASQAEEDDSATAGAFSTSHNPTISGEAKLAEVMEQHASLESLHSPYRSNEEEDASVAVEALAASSNATTAVDAKVATLEEQHASSKSEHSAHRCKAEEEASAAAEALAASSNPTADVKAKLAALKALRASLKSEHTAHRSKAGEDASATAGALAASKLHASWRSLHSAHRSKAEEDASAEDEAFGASNYAKVGVEAKLADDVNSSSYDSCDVNINSCEKDFNFQPTPSPSLLSLSPSTAAAVHAPVASPPISTSAAAEADSMSRPPSSPHSPSPNSFFIGDKAAGTSGFDGTVSDEGTSGFDRQELDIALLNLTAYCSSPSRPPTLRPSEFIPPRPSEFVPPRPSESTGLRSPQASHAQQHRPRPTRPPRVHCTRSGHLRRPQKLISVDGYAICRKGDECIAPQCKPCRKNRILSSSCSSSPPPISASTAVASPAASSPSFSFSAAVEADSTLHPASPLHPHMYGVCSGNPRAVADVQRSSAARLLFFPLAQVMGTNPSYPSNSVSAAAAAAFASCSPAALLPSFPSPAPAGSSYNCLAPGAIASALPSPASPPLPGPLAALLLPALPSPSSPAPAAVAADTASFDGSEIHFPGGVPR